MSDDGNFFERRLTDLDWHAAAGVGSLDELDPPRPGVITWEAFFASHDEDSAGKFLLEMLARMASVLRNCPLEVQELFINRLVDLITESDAGSRSSGEPDA